MKARKLFHCFLVLPLLLMFNGCPSPLVSGLKADLVLTLGRFNPTATTSVKGAISGTLSIPVCISDLTGKAVTGTYTVAFTLSGDNSLKTTTDNTDLGSKTVTAGTEQVVDLTVPGTLTAGSYTLFAVLQATADQDASLANNTVSIPVTLGADQPNLQIAMTLPIPGAPPGGTFTASYKVSNTGFAKIDPGTSFTISYMITIGSLVNKSVGSTTITLSSSLYADGFITGTGTLTMPSITDMGSTDATFVGYTGTLTATVDSGNVITESNKADNTSSASIIAAAIKPDLAISSVSLPNGASYVKPGNAMQAAVVLQNQGYAVAPAGYSVILFVDINANSAYDPGTDLLLYTWSAPPAVPFDPFSGHNTITLTIPDGQTFPSTVPTSGAYRLGAAITGTVTGEVNTANNTGVSSSIFNFVASSVDLSLTNMSTTLAATLPTTGGTIPVTMTIHNAGDDALSTPFVIHLYASSDGTLAPAGDLDLGTTIVSTSIPAKKSIYVNATASVPAAAVGFYTLYWVLDSTNVVTEIDETNNTPSSANNCFVFFIVSNGTGWVNANLFAFKPQGAASQSSNLYGEFFNVSGGSWNYWNWFGWGSALNPGDMYGSYCNVNLNLVSGTTYGNLLYTNSSAATPYAFRYVPSYVTSVSLAALPIALTVNDSLEPNNSESAAYALSGSNNPLFGFVNAYTQYTSSGYDYDYYTFSIP